MAFADEKRHDEDTRRGDFGENFFEVRLLFPKGFANFGENLPAAQFRRVLKHRRGGLVVQRRAVAQHDQRGVGEVFTLHAGILPEAPLPASRLMQFFMKPFDGNTV